MKLFSLLIVGLLIGCSGANTTVLDVNGNEFKLVKPAQKLSNGTETIAEYIKVGDTNNFRYFPSLTAGAWDKPIFTKIRD